MGSVLSGWKSRMLIVGAAVLFSTGGAAIKSCAMTGWQVAGFRSLVAAGTIAVLVSSSRRSWNRRTFAVGVAYAATVILFVMANKLTTAAHTIFLQSGAPLYILLLSPWLLGERILRQDWAVMGLVGLGLGLLFFSMQSPLSTAPHPALGNVLAGLSGLSWAGTVMGLRWVGRGGDASSNAGMGVVLVGNLMAFVFCVPWMGPMQSVRVMDGIIVAGLGVFQIGLAYWCLTVGITRVAALEASILLLIEPVVNPIWAFLIHHEIPTVLSLVGGAFILGATILKGMRGNEKPR